MLSTSRFELIYLLAVLWTCSSGSALNTCFKGCFSQLYCYHCSVSKQDRFIIDARIGGGDVAFYTDCHTLMAPCLFLDGWRRHVDLFHNISIQPLRVYRKYHVMLDLVYNINAVLWLVLVQFEIITAKPYARSTYCFWPVDFFRHVGTCTVWQL